MDHQHLSVRCELHVEISFFHCIITPSNNSRLLCTITCHRSQVRGWHRCLGACHMLLPFFVIFHYLPGFSRLTAARLRCLWTHLAAFHPSSVRKAAPPGRVAAGCDYEASRRRPGRVCAPGTADYSDGLERGGISQMSVHMPNLRLRWCMVLLETINRKYALTEVLVQADRIFILNVFHFLITHSRGRMGLYVP